MAIRVAQFCILGLVQCAGLCVAQRAESLSNTEYAQALIELLADQQLCESAQEALLKLTPAPAELLASLVVRGTVDSEDDLTRRRRALATIGRMARDAKPAFDLLQENWRTCPAELLKDLSYCVTRMAPYVDSSESEILALIQELEASYRERVLPLGGTTAFGHDRLAAKGRMSVDLESSSDAELIAVIESGTRYAREVAVEELARRSSQAAIPILVQAVRAGPAPPLDMFFERASDGLLKLAPEHPANAKAYGRRLRTHSDPLVRLAAARQLALLEAGAKTALPDLIAGLLDRDLAVVCAAIEAIGMIGIEAKEAEAALREAMRREPGVAVRAWGALKSIGVLR